MGFVIAYTIGLLTLVFLLAVFLTWLINPIIDLTVFQVFVALVVFENTLHRVGTAYIKMQNNLLVRQIQKEMDEDESS